MGTTRGPEFVIKMKAKPNIRELFLIGGKSEQEARIEFELFLFTTNKGEDYPVNTVIIA